jgi:spoIIIJ-associated protein
MEWIEVTGKTVEEASEKALDLLGVADDDAEIEVLGEPKMGLFGRLREEARVRARLLPEVPRPKEDRSRRRRSGGRPKDEAPTGPEGAGAAPAGRAGGRTQRPAPAAGEGRRGAVAVAEERSTREDPMNEDAAEVPVAEQAGVAKEFVDGLLAIMEVEATSEVVLIDDDTAELRVNGSDLGLLIGPKGATLLALQDLARTVVQRRTGARTGRLLLDVSGYRQKRKEALERFTQKVAEEVLATGTATAMEPMSSADRKIVHDTVNAIDGVATTSDGEDPRRHVVVRPA